MPDIFDITAQSAISAISAQILEFAQFAQFAEIASGKSENGKVRGTPQSLCDSSPINKGAKKRDEIAAKAAVDGRSATPVDGRPRR